MLIGFFKLLARGDIREGTWLVGKKIFGAGVVNHPANPPMVKPRMKPHPMYYPTLCAIMADD